MEKEKERTVFIMNDGGHDYSDAIRFGSLHFLNISRKAKWDIARLYTEITEGMEEANRDDLILVSGLTTHCCVATALMIERFGCVNYLIFKEDKYEEKNLVTNQELYTMSEE